MIAVTDDLVQWFRDLVDKSEDHKQAIHDAYQHLENAGLISRVTVHRYLCGKCGPRATIIRIGDRTLARTKDYKLSPGLNEQRTVESARRRRTLDGNRHWPGHTYDVDDLADGGPTVGLDASCRHGTATILAVDILEVTKNVVPGHPGKPTLF